MKKQFNLEMISQYRTEVFGITIIWIMLLHGIILENVYIPPSLEWLYVILKHGNVGVDIFLFLSGIGLFYSFSKNNNLEKYLKKRFIRILVPYGIIGGSYFVFCDIIMRNSVWAFIKNFSLMSFVFSGNKLIWYIFGILLCYLMFPYLYQIFYEEHGEYKNTCFRNFILLVGALVLFGFVLRREYRDVYNNIEIAVTRLPVFVCGVAAAGVIKEKRSIHIGWVVAAFITVITSYPIFVNKIFTGIYQRYYYCVLGIALVIVFSFMFSVIKNKKVHSFFVWFGNISLELYCAHILLRNLYMKLEWSKTYTFAKYLIILAVAIFVAKYVSMIGKGLVKKTSAQNINFISSYKKGERIVWIDQFKAIVFYFVILGHLPVLINAYDIFTGETNIITILIYSFHMPAFFFISGVTFKKEKILKDGLKIYYKGLCQRVLLPYFWINLILLPVWAFTFKILSYRKNSLASIFYGIFYGNPNVHGTPQGALWFLLTLFFALGIYALLVKGAEGSYKKMIPAIIAFAAVGYITRGINVIWHLNGVPVSVVFIFLGNVFFDLYKNGYLKKIFKFSIPSLLFAMLMAFMWLKLAMYNGKVSMIANVYGTNNNCLDIINYLLFYLCALIAIVVLIYVIEKLPSNKILTYYGKNTLLYIGLHVPLFKLFEIWVPELTKQTWFLFLLSFLLYFAMIPCSLLVNKMFPYVNGNKYVETNITKFGKIFITIIVLIIPVYILLNYRFANIFVNPASRILLVVFVLCIGIVASLFAQKYVPSLYGQQIEVSDTVTRKGVAN